MSITDLLPVTRRRMRREIALAATSAGTTLRDAVARFEGRQSLLRDQLRERSAEKPDRLPETDDRLPHALHGGPA